MPLTNTSVMVFAMAVMRWQQSDVQQEAAGGAIGAGVQLEAPGSGHDGQASVPPRLSSFLLRS